MKGWKTWTGAALVAAGAVARFLDHQEIAELILGLGAALGLIGLGHKLEKC